MTETTAQEAMQSFFERLIERHPEQRERFMHYINMTDEEREQLQKEQARADEEFSRQAYRNLQARKKEALWKMSLWNGGRPFEFTFYDWDKNRQRDSERAGRVARKAVNLTKEILQKPFNVTLAGNSGVGKTSLAVAMLTMLRENGASTMAVSTAELEILVDESFNDDLKARKLYRLTRGMKDVDVLLLDDFGTEGGLDMRGAHRKLQTIIYDVANVRAEKKATIITTNNSDAELHRIYPEKTLSRLMTKNEQHKIYMDGLEDVRQV